MKIVAKADRLLILLEGMERFWAAKAHILLQVNDVVSVVWNHELPVRPNGFYIRAPGTSVPSYFAAGSYMSGDAWEFWYLKRRTPGELIITTKLKKYRVIRLTIDESTAFTAREWFNSNQNMRNIA